LANKYSPFFIADERNELNNDPRKMQITKEIRDIEDAMEKIRRKIDDESSILQSLRQTADAQNTLLTLQEQCEKDVDILEDNIREESYSMKKFDIDTPRQLPRDGDDDGDQLSKAVDLIVDTVRGKYDAASSRFEGSKEEIAATQKTIAEKSALLMGDQKTIATLKSGQTRVSNNVEKVRTTMEELRRHESRLGYKIAINDDNPREVLQYIDGRLDEVEGDAPELNAARVAKKVLKRVLRKV
jgi:DNA repair protein RAD50